MINSLFATASLLPALASLAAIMALFTLVWRESVRRQDAGIVDLVWAMGFVLVGGIEAALAPSLTAAGWLMLGLVSLWAARLSAHLILRHRAATQEDARYAAMRQAGGPQWAKESLWRVFWVQAVALWAVATPIHAALWPLKGDASSAVLLASPIVLFGLAVFLIGFAIESAADYQLARFRANAAQPGRLLTDGLFALCRHPNYLGEILVWWGLGLLAFGMTDRAWALLGPALITFFLIRVSGVPPLETVLAQRPGFQEWAAKTPALWPLPWRRAGISPRQKASSKHGD